MEMDMEGDTDVEAIEEIQRRIFSIGEFICEFSQLEFTIRVLLHKLLELNDEQFDIVTSPYDFRMLCKVTEEIIKNKYPEKTKNCENFFKSCLAINDERVRIAHGLWCGFGDSVRHVSRGTLKAKHYYENSEDLPKLINTVQILIQKILSI
jgi:hypothetical protein